MPIEIFRAGTHTDMRGITLDFSEADLSASAAAYDPAVSEAPCVVGHPKDNAPAYGWIKSLKVEDGSLVAEPHQVDAEFAEMVRAGRFKKVSASFYLPGAPANPVPGTHYLRHVGFLGAQPPAVKGLKPVEFADADDQCFTVEFGEDSGADLSSPLARTLRSLREWFIGKFGQEEADKAMPYWDVDSVTEAAVRDRIEKHGNGPAFAEGDGPDDNDNPKEHPMPVPDSGKPPSGAAPAGAAPASGLPADYDRRLSDLEKKEAAFAEKLRLSDAEAKVATVVQAGRLTPAQAEGLAQFMAALPEEDTVSFGEGDSTCRATPGAWLESFLNRLPVQVDFAERSAEQGDSPTTATPDEIANRAVAYQERCGRDGISITTTEAVTAVRLGKDKETK